MRKFKFHTNTQRKGPNTRTKAVTLAGEHTSSRLTGACKHMHSIHFSLGEKDRDRTYQGAEFSCNLKASLVVCPSEGLHMTTLVTVSFRSLKPTTVTIFTDNTMGKAKSSS